MAMATDSNWLSQSPAAGEKLGIGKGDVRGLENAIVEDAAIPAAKGIGSKTRDWITTAALKVVGKAGDAALEVAKAQMAAELTKLVSGFLGLS
jgi:hypothetical protein